MKKKHTSKRFLCIFLSVLMATLLIAPFAFAQGEGESTGGVAVFGDSLSLGFRVDLAGSMETYDKDCDIAANVLHAGYYDPNGVKGLYSHGYPAVFARMLGCESFYTEEQYNGYDPTARDEGPKWDWGSETNWKAVYNLSPLGATSGDMLSFLTEPEAIYSPEGSTVPVEERQRPYEMMTTTVQNCDTIIVALGGNDLMDDAIPAIAAEAARILGVDFNFDPQTGFASNNGNQLKFDQNTINQLLNIFSKDSLTRIMQPTIDAYASNIQGVLDQIVKLNDDATVAMMSNFNPYGQINARNMFIEAYKSGEFMKRLNADLQTIWKLFFGTAKQNQNLNSMSENQVQNEADTLRQDLMSVNSGDELMQVLNDASIPLISLIVGDRFDGVYEQMNAAVKKAADSKDQAVYVDIHDAPSSAMFDPHIGEATHQWIAKKLYATLYPQQQESEPQSEQQIKPTPQKVYPWVQPYQPAVVKPVVETVRTFIQTTVRAISNFFSGLFKNVFGFFRF